MKSRTAALCFATVIGLLLLAGNSAAQGRPHDEGTYGTSMAPAGTKTADRSDAARLKSGTKIRIQQEFGQRTGYEEGIYLEGRFQSLEDGILTMTVGIAVVSTPIDRIRKLQVKKGGSGAWVGAFCGLALGGVMAAAAQPDRSNEGLASLGHIGGDITQGGVIVLAGVIVGAGVGASLDSDRWQNVSLQHQSFGQMGRTGADYRLAYSFRF